jgi:hypothetical protein
LRASSSRKICQGNSWGNRIGRLASGSLALPCASPLVTGRVGSQRAENFQPCQHPANRGPNPPRQARHGRTRSRPIGQRRPGALLCGPIVANVANVANVAEVEIDPSAPPNRITRQASLRREAAPQSHVSRDCAFSAAPPCDNCDKSRCARAAAPANCRNVANVAGGHIR